MKDRTPTIGGNWKMNLHRDEVTALTGLLIEKIKPAGDVEVVICPSFPYLSQVADQLGSSGSQIKLGAQDFYFEPNGAFTGEVSLSQLKDIGVQLVLAGHSERRHVIKEPDVLINEKVLAALEAGFEVILCIGEKIEQRESGQTDAINAAQLSYGLAGVRPDQMSRVVIAYEPVWAIGTGKTATPEDAQCAHLAIRRHLSYMFDQSTADGCRIQYGGSVKGANAKELFSRPDIDGGLIGGASLKADEFTAIVNAAR